MEFFACVLNASMCEITCVGLVPDMYPPLSVLFYVGLLKQHHLSNVAFRICCQVSIGQAPLQYSKQVVTDVSSYIHILIFKGYATYKNT